jgi:hypothetical protein
MEMRVIEDYEEDSRREEESFMQGARKRVKSRTDT